MNYRMVSIIVTFVFCGVLMAPVVADEGYWKSRSIDAERDDLGLYCSLKIDGSDQAYIAYYSNTDECLKLAWEPYSRGFGDGTPTFAWSRLTTARGMGKGVSLWVNDTGRRFAFSCINQTNHVFLGEGAFRAAVRDGFAPYVVSMEDVTQHYSVASVPTSIIRDKARYGTRTYIAYTDTNVQQSGLELFKKFQCYESEPELSCGL